MGAGEMFVEVKRVPGGYGLSLPIIGTLSQAMAIVDAVLSLPTGAAYVPETGTIVPESGSLDALRIERNDPSHAYVEPPDESDLPPMATQDADDNVGDLLAGTVP